MPAARPIGFALDEHELTAGRSQSWIAGEAHEAHGKIAEQQQVDRRHRQQLAERDHDLARDGTDEAGIGGLRMAGEPSRRMGSQSDVRIHEQEMRAPRSLGKATAAPVGHA